MEQRVVTAPGRSGGGETVVSRADVAEQLGKAFPGMGIGALAERMEIVITEASPERVVATMPVEGNTQPYGLLHGGASVVLAETIGSIASALHAGPERIAVGIEINATHHRAVSSGTVTGVASAIHLGGTLATYEIVITDDHDHRLCTSRITCVLRATPQRN